MTKPKTFGQWVRKSRKDLSLTLRDVSKKANTTISYLHNVETGKSEPTIKKAAEISKAFDMKLHQVLKEVDI